MNMLVNQRLFLLLLESLCRKARRKIGRDVITGKAFRRLFQYDSVLPSMQREHGRIVRADL
jgi:hypothetical protein